MSRQAQPVDSSAARSTPHRSNEPLDLDALAAAVAHHLAAALPTPAPVDALLDAHAAAALLAVPASWLLAQAREDRVPHVRLGKYVRFDRDELLEWRSAQAHGPRTGSRPVPRRSSSPMPTGSTSSRTPRSTNRGPK